MHEFYENGYGVSVISDGYGSGKGLKELAVLIGDESVCEICYSTPITNDVLGWLTDEEVLEIIEKVKALPCNKGGIK